MRSSLITVAGCALWLLPTFAAAQGDLDPPPPSAEQAPPIEQAPPAPAPTPPAGYGSQPVQQQPAQPPPAAGWAAPPPPPPAAAAPAHSSDVRYMDANADRVIIYSTAETHPAGTFFFSDYELFLLQFGYAVTDNIQLAISGVPPLFEDQPYFFDFAFKANFLRGPSFRAAVLLAFDVMIFPGGVDISSGGADENTLLGGRVGGIGTVCFIDTCQSSLSINIGTFVNNVSNDFLPFTAALGVIGRVSDLVALLVEPVYGFAVGSEVRGGDGFILNYGIRLSGAHWGVDLSLIRPIGIIDEEDNPFILGFPWVSFTYRSDWDQPAQAPAPTNAPVGRLSPPAWGF